MGIWPRLVYTLLVIYRGRLSVALGLKTKSDNILISEDYIDRYFDLETIFKNFVRATRIFVKDSFFCILPTALQRLFTRL